jgi:hypothetical protein
MDPTIRLRPYHNPENVDESRVPKGWRFRYADEVKSVALGRCAKWEHFDFTNWRQFMGTLPHKTYIVPVA